MYIKPTDLAVWVAVQSCAFNTLHICDYAGSYDDLTPFLDYPGHVVNCSLTLGQRILCPTDVFQMFGRPFMGGLERKGVLATGSLEDIRVAAQGMLAAAPERFIRCNRSSRPQQHPYVLRVLARSRLASSGPTACRSVAWFRT